MEKQRGLTLLEMLVSILILTTVLALTSTSYSYYVGQLNRQQTAFGARLQDTKLAQAWQNQLSAAFAYFVEVAPNTNRIWFKGNATDVSWVASTSLQQPGITSVAWLGMRDKQLVYCEQTLTDTLFVNPQLDAKTLCDSYMLEIAPADKISLEYFSWPSLVAKQNAETTTALAGALVSKPQWFKKVDAFETGLLPGWVKLLLSTAEGEREYWLRLENSDRERLGIFLSESIG